MKKNEGKNNLGDDIIKEWLITNGIGGYCSSTIIGANTRKYHGILVASLTPPARRHLILSKLDESIEMLEKLASIPSKDTLLTMFASGLMGIARDFAICLDLHAKNLEENK